MATVEEQEKSEGSFTNDRGHKIFCKYWSKQKFNSDQKPRALLFVAHGLSEHCLPYTELAERLTEKGFYVFSHDHQGHGQSGGSRIYIEDLRYFTADVFKHIDSVKKEFPDLPVFILGHSMGGAITILSALDKPDYFKGVGLIGPVVTPDPEAAGRARIFIGKMVARLFPQMPVMWLKSELITNDKEVRQKYEDDPLNYHGGMKARTGVSILAAIQEIESKLETIKWPFLVVHGAGDKIVPPNGSKCLYEKACSEDKTLVVLEGALHQPHKEVEPVRSKALDTVVDWFDKRAE